MKANNPHCDQSGTFENKKMLGPSDNRISSPAQRQNMIVSSSGGLGLCTAVVGQPTAGVRDGLGRHVEGAPRANPQCARCKPLRVAALQITNMETVRNGENKRVCEWMDQKLLLSGPVTVGLLAFATAQRRGWGGGGGGVVVHARCFLRPHPDMRGEPETDQATLETSQQQLTAETRDTSHMTHGRWTLIERRLDPRGRWCGLALRHHTNRNAFTRPQPRGGGGGGGPDACHE